MVQMSTRARGRVVGSLFWLAMLAYLSGTALVGAAAGRPILTAAGALLMLLNSVVVAGIGILVRPVLRRHDETSASAYLVSRMVEAVLLAVGVVFVLRLMPVAGEYAYQVAMIALGLGGVVFCRVLLRARLVPRFVAIWGLVGYALLGLGAALEVLGVGVGVGLLLSVPGGLFELALGVLLLVRGFPMTLRRGAAVVVPPMVAVEVAR
jgi:uncharacterized protein DUF4386